MLTLLKSQWHASQGAPTEMRCQHTFLIPSAPLIAVAIFFSSSSVAVRKTESTPSRSSPVAYLHWMYWLGVLSKCCMSKQLYQTCQEFQLKKSVYKVNDAYLHLLFFLKQCQGYLKTVPHDSCTHLISNVCLLKDFDRLWYSECEFRSSIDCEMSYRQSDC